MITLTVASRHGFEPQLDLLVGLDSPAPPCCAPADNVYGVLPISMAVKVSVGLMVVHQWVAFALYCTPLLYMWEKLIHTHTPSPGTSACQAGCLSVSCPHTVSCGLSCRKACRCLVD